MEPARGKHPTTPSPRSRPRQRGPGCGRARTLALRAVVFGQDRAVDFMGLPALVAGGWAMISGGPGAAKTRLVEGLARVTGLSFGRVPFTPDLDLAAAARPVEGARVTGLDGGRRAPEPPLAAQQLLARRRTRPRLRPRCAPP